jgi:hypothetical protein
MFNGCGKWTPVIHPCFGYRFSSADPTEIADNFIVIASYQIALRFQLETQGRRHMLEFEGIEWRKSGYEIAKQAKREGCARE